MREPIDKFSFSAVQSPLSFNLDPGSEPRLFAVRPAVKFVCTVPEPLGAVTKLDLRGGRIVAETESGIDMILPLPRDGE